MSRFNIGDRVKVTRPVGGPGPGEPGWGPDRPTSFTGMLVGFLSHSGFSEVRIDLSCDPRHVFGKSSWYCAENWMQPEEGPW